MKTVLKIIVLTAIIIWLLIHTSCTKETIQDPTCFRYREIVTYYTGEMIYIRTDTVYPGGRQSTYACGDDLKKLENYKPSLVGCEQGWQIVTYEILK